RLRAARPGPHRALRQLQLQADRPAQRLRRRPAARGRQQEGRLRLGLPGLRARGAARRPPELRARPGPGHHRQRLIAMNLGEILADAARHHPDRTAIVWHDGHERRTYREVDDRAAALAAGLVEELKVQPGDRVAVMMSNSPELLETLFAVWKAGATISP